jgi:hypothetical protein
VKFGHRLETWQAYSTNQLTRHPHNLYRGADVRAA